MPRLSPLAARLQVGGADAWEVHARALARVARGDEVIVLSIGDPDFPTPPPIVDAAIASLRRGRTHYTPARGEPALLTAIAERATSQAGVPIAADRVVFFPGAQSALYAVMTCLVGDGGDVIVPEPAYATYEGVVAASGGRMVHVPLRPERGFDLQARDVAAALTPRTRAVLVNTPHNPTGAAMTADRLAELVRMCADHDVWLVSDEVYGVLTFARPHASALAAPGACERVAVVSSLSKSHAMTGFRHGWAIVPPALGETLDLLLQSMLFGCPPFVQDAGLAALRGDQAATVEMRRAYERRARLMVDALASAPGVRARMPEGGMFVLVDVRESGLDGEAFADRLLDEEAVSVLPVDAFGPSGRGHVRIGLTAADDVLFEAARRIARLARRLVGGA
jgi:arginine:pyruvate transaminase